MPKALDVKAGHRGSALHDRSREYGVLRDRMAGLADARFTRFRDEKLFTRVDYESEFDYTYVKMAEHYHLRFDSSRSRATGKPSRPQ